ncbi:MAG: hypothetical protein AVDCRST_MAG49-3554 [uncultured Thermomicrobiales bacterium]|uniref:2TM domain-containing protein n=1 Tax=uncultured Thermomicrobiales bacterium TaxID=1645740 RepID=A0A6J4V8W7_9BACT|nr:MAG: hypothetical protein AVDCRST_MAG49-3554 [uncultured Thermomicrobiales bacterium]
MRETGGRDGGSHGGHGRLHAPPGLPPFPPPHAPAVPGRRPDRVAAVTPRWGEPATPAVSTDDAVDDPVERQARGRACQLRDFYSHAGSYAAVNLFLFVLDVLTGSGWWFYWPLLGWGIGLASHAWSVYGVDAHFGDAWEERKVRELVGRRTAESSPVSGREARDEVARAVEEGTGRVAAVRAAALGIANPAVRDQVLRIGLAADRVLVVLAERPGDPATAREFLDRYLGPTETIVDRYARLTARGVAAAGPALAKVEGHDLPLLEAKLNELYEQLHRGDVIDLETASEMLEFDLSR